MKLPTPKTQSKQEGVVIEEFETLNFRLFGAIANGNAVIAGNNNKALKFTRGQDFVMKNGQKGYYVTIQVIEAGIGKQIKEQSWNRTKVVKEKVEVARKSKVKQEQVIINTEVEQEDLF